MRAATAFINMDSNQKRTVYIKHAKDEVIGFIVKPRNVSVSVEVATGVWSSVKQYFEIDDNNTAFPVFAKNENGVKVILETGSTPAYAFMPIIFYRDEEIKGIVEKDKKIHLVPIDRYDEPLDMPKKVNIYTHNKDYDMFIAGIMQDLGGTSYSRYKLYLNDDEIADYFYMPFMGIGLLNFLPIRSWIRKGEKLSLEVIDAAGSSRARMHLLCAMGEIDVSELPYIDNINPIRPIPDISKDSRLAIITEPQPIPTPPIPPEIPPYPRPPEEQRDVISKTPPAVNPNVTNTQKPKEYPEPTEIIRPNEVPVVQTMPSPYGGVRPVADTRGRQRVATSAISYKAGKLEVTDPSEYDLISGVVIKCLSIYAETGNWELRVLPLYDRLIGKKIDDMDAIYITEGQGVEMDIEAVEVKASCTTATMSNPGKLFWEAEI